MSNKAHDHVHRLARSMTSAEKRYFKLHTSRNLSGGRSNQQILFNAIAGMEEYDEALLLERFSKAPFIKHFAVTKRRLYESILKALEGFHAETSLDARLSSSLHQVELLYQRGLYEDAAKILGGVHKVARKHDRHAHMSAVLHWERRLLEHGNYGRAKIEDLDRIAEESLHLRAEQEELDELWDIKSKVLMNLYRQGQARDTTSLAAMDQLMDHPLLTTKKPLRSAHARFLFHHLHAAASFAKGDLECCMTHLSANRILLRTEKDRFITGSDLVLGVLSNLAYVQLRSGYYDQALSTLKEFRECPTDWNMAETEDLDLKLFSTSTSLELTMHAQVGAFDKALEMTRSVERGLALYGPRLGTVRKAGIYYQMAYANFGAGRFEQALKWGHRLLNDVRLDESAEVVCFGRILYMLCLLESGKLDLIPYTLRNTERLLMTRNRTHRFEVYSMELVRELLRTRDPNAQKPILERFLEKMEELEKDPMEQVVFDHLDPIAWVQSKCGESTFAERVKERAVQQNRAA